MREARGSVVYFIYFFEEHRARVPRFVYLSVLASHIKRHAQSRNPPELDTRGFPYRRVVLFI